MAESTHDDRYRRALELSPRFYDAALDPVKWPEVLRALRQLVQADIGVFNLARLQNPSILLSYDDGMSDEQKRAYLSYEGFAQDDPRTPLCVTENFRPRHCREYLSDDTWYASKAYRELHQPWGFDYTLWFSVPDRDQDCLALFGFTRHHDKGPYTQDDIDHLSLYAPHLRRAMEVAMTLATARADRQAFARAFDHVEAAMLIVDRFGHPVHVNPSARRLLDEGRAITDSAGALRAIDGPTTDRLRAAILDAGLAGMMGRQVPTLQMTLPARHGDQPLYLSLSALTENVQDTPWLGPDRGLVGVFITDPARRFETDVERLQRLFGLTATEARILDGLVATGSAPKTAEATGYSYESVRT